MPHSHQFASAPSGQLISRTITLNLHTLLSASGLATPSPLHVPMASGSATVRFEADFKKVPGTLTLTATHVAWVPKEAGAMDRQNQAMNRVINMLASKAGAPKVSLKLVFKDDIPSGGLFFTFTNPATREDDRKTVQDTLIPFVSANRAGPSVPTAPSVGTPGDAGSTPGTPSAVALGKRKADGASPAGSGSGSGGAGKKDRPEDVNLKKRVLKKNPTLNLLHRELVQTKQITESEFWEGREGLIHAERLAQAQRPGRPSRLLDDRFDLNTNRNNASTVGGTGVGVKARQETGPMIIKLDKELTREIFEEFPVVQDAYAKHVPGISEAEFWSRYFQSQLWERHRASVRQSTNDEVTKRKDDIFDQYLEEPDWNIEPRHQQGGDVERFLDLAATEEDHGESSTQRDVTMQAGRERASLPLMRRFNDHSNKLLRRGNQNGADAPGYLNTVLPDDTDIYAEIDLEDLRGPAASNTISLDVQDDEEQDKTKGTTTTRSLIPGKTPEELAELARDQASLIQAYKPDFESISLPTPAGGWEKNRIESGDSPEQAKAHEKFYAQKLGADAAGQVVRDMHVASNAENAPIVPLPENLFDQMRSCHNAATEFLRQYWSAILPTSAGTLGPSTIAAKNAKAEKMAGYLRLTEGKVNAVINTATLVGVDPERIRAALAPTVGAVKVALAREEKRTAGTNGA